MIGSLDVSRFLHWGQEGAWFFIAFIVALGVLIFVHEFGHFFAARRLGVGVTKFSFGFGPKIFGIKRGDTEYLVSAVPLGGYVRMIGEGEEEGEEAAEPLSEEDRARSFSHKPVWRKAAIVAAGPFGNLVFAVVAFTFVFLSGVPSVTAKVGDIVANSPAASAGLLAGDVVESIGGKRVSSWEDLAEAVRGASPGVPLSFKVRRDGAEVVLSVTPEARESKNLFGETVREPKVGVVAGRDIVTRKAGPVEAVVLGVKETWKMVELTAMTVVKLVQRVLPSSTLGGPILIAQMAGEQAKAGAAPFLYFLALLSVNLGVLNLLPLPVLDGGHLVFFGIEAVRRKPVSMKARLYAQQAGLALILLLTALVFYNDIARLASRG